MTQSHSACISVCNALLRGELSAMEAYDQAIEKFPDAAATDDLERIRSEHSRAATRLAANVRDMGGEAQTDSGAWGVFTGAIQGTANLFGTASAIESLRQGEEMGRKDYQNALLNDDVMIDCKLMIREEMLPRVIKHIAHLEKLELTA